MQTEADILIAVLKRLKKKNIIDLLEINYNDDKSGDISYYAPDRLGYYPTFRFNSAGEIIHAGVTI